MMSNSSRRKVELLDVAVANPSALTPDPLESSDGADSLVNHALGLSEELLADLLVVAVEGPSAMTGFYRR
jgi:hypothetical protein